MVPKVVRCLIALVGASLALVRAGDLEDSLVRLSDQIPYVGYGGFLYGRKDGMLAEHPTVKEAERSLQAALDEPLAIDRLAKLAEHSDPRVRTLALLMLYARVRGEVVLRHPLVSPRIQRPIDLHPRIPEAAARGVAAAGELAGRPPCIRAPASARSHGSGNDGESIERTGDPSRRDEG